MDNRWKIIDRLDQLDAITINSSLRPQVLFKHSTRCSISSMALNRLKDLEAGFFDKADFHYLDLIAYREISNAIAERFQVHHESPQVILVKNGEAVYDASHMEISTQELISEI